MDEQRINDYHAWFNNAPFPGDANDSTRSLYSEVQQRAYIENRRIAAQLGVSNEDAGTRWVLLALLAGLALGGVILLTVRVTRSLSSTEDAEEEPDNATSPVMQPATDDAKEETKPYSSRSARYRAVRH
ncbi:hypothetical protein [Actinobaculum sp. 313]|nr:hypothetical protein [Actinobaculum sp. 313]